MKKAPKQDVNAPLDELRVLLSQQTTSLQPIIHQVSALPVDSQLEYYFIPAKFMKDYSPFYQPQQAPYKNLKLINYERPAISLSFFSKHKYTIQRAVDPQNVMLHLRNYRNELFNRSLVQQLSISQQKELQQADEVLRTLRDHPDAYQSCFSNYHHYYKYWYCSYRYFEDNPQTKTETSSEHMLKHTERVKGQVHERLNIIFIDPEYITRPVPHDHKQIDRELETFPIRIKQGITTLYLRKA